MQIGANIGIGNAAFGKAAGSTGLRGTIGPVVGLTVTLSQYLAGLIGPVVGLDATLTYTDFADETGALLSAMTTEPDDTRKTLIDTTIKALKTAGIWAKLDTLYFLAAHNAQAARLNWKSPGTFTLSPVNSPTFTTDTGYASDGSTSYLNSGYIPNTHGVTLTANAACIFGRLMDNMVGGAANGGRIAGGGYPSTGVRLDIRPFSSSQLEGAVNGGAVTVRSYSSTNALLAAIDRTGVASKNTYLAGVAGTPQTITDTPARSTGDLYVLAFLSTAGAPSSYLPSGRRVGVVGWGGHLTDTEHANLNTIVEAYLSGL